MADARTCHYRMLGDPRRYSPFCQVDWRWQAAREDFQRGKHALKSKDQVIAKARRFLIEQSRANTDRERLRLSQRWPTLAATRAIHSNDGVERWQIEARLLAGTPVAEVARRTGIPVDLVKTYAALFFDVQGRLSAHDWIRLEAVGVGRWAAIPTEGDIWRYVADSGGTAVVELLIGDYLCPVHDDPDRHDLAEDIRVMVRFATASMADKKAFRAILRE